MITSQYARDAQSNRNAAEFSPLPDYIKAPIFFRNKIDVLRGGESCDCFVSI
jgi:hypothetical protein